jgi:hypothetical protein
MEVAAINSINISNILSPYQIQKIAVQYNFLHKINPYLFKSIIGLFGEGYYWRFCT